MRRRSAGLGTTYSSPKFASRKNHRTSCDSILVPLRAAPEMAGATLKLRMVAYGELTKVVVTLLKPRPQTLPQEFFFYRCAWFPAEFLGIFPREVTTRIRAKAHRSKLEHALH